MSTHTLAQICTHSHSPSRQALVWLIVVYFPTIFFIFQNPSFLSHSEGGSEASGHCLSFDFGNINEITCHGYVFVPPSVLVNM